MKPTGRNKIGGRKKKTDQLSILAISAVVLIFGGFLFFYINQEPPEAIDKVTNCPVDGARGHTILILDRTDGFTENQKRNFTDVLEKAGKNLRVGERLSIYELDPVKMGGLSEVLFTLCRPKAKAEADALTQNPDFFQKKFEEKFKQPLEKYLEEFNEKPLEDEGFSSSPIMETLMDVAGLGSFNPSMQRREIILFSDLLQHSSIVSFYIISPDFDVLVKNQGLGKFIPDLRGVKVEVRYIIRIDGIGFRRQTDQLLGFWDSYFEAAGAVWKIEKIR